MDFKGKVKREVRRLRERDRKKKLFQQHGKSDFIAEVQGAGDELAKQAVWLMNNKLVGLGTLVVEGQPTIALMFKESLWAWKGDKLILKAATDGETNTQE